MASAKTILDNAGVKQEDVDAARETLQAAIDALTEADTAVPVAGITLDRTALALEPQKTFRLNAKVHPENASDKRILWTTSNKQIAVVDENGVVTAISPGTVTITAATVNGGFAASREVTVAETTVDVISPVETDILSAQIERETDTSGTVKITGVAKNPGGRRQGTDAALHVSERQRHREKYDPPL